jgi:hypothetical protein
LEQGIVRKRIEREPIKVARHPSGRPISSERTIYLSQHRIPENGALTPRLRREGLSEAIGFTVPWLTAPDDDE